MEQPITDKKNFSSITLRDLEETQRKITLRLKKLSETDSEGIKKLAEELKYWTKIILYEKAKYLLAIQMRSKIKFEKIKGILEE